MASPLASDAPEKEGSAWIADEQPPVKHDEEEDDDDEHGDERGDGENNKPAEHTTINVTNRSEGNIKDDCSDITDNHETEEQSSRTFPQKLMDVLMNEEHHSIISFLEHGNGFIIHKKRVFAAEVLPKYFKASKFTSFTRKLNRWGFQRISRGPETGAYYHKLFRRDKPEYVLQMSSNSGSKYRAPAFPTPLLPNLQGGGMIPAATPQGVYPFVAPNMMGGVPMAMPNLFPGAAAVTLQQQQQAMWQQQMQFMQFQMMQMQQQQQAMQAAMIQQQSPQAVPHGQPQAPAYGMASPAPPTGPMMAAPTAGTLPLDANGNQQQQYHQEPMPSHVADLSPVGEDGASESDVANVNAV